MLDAAPVFKSIVQRMQEAIVHMHFTHLEFEILATKCKCVSQILNCLIWTVNLTTGVVSPIPQAAGELA